MRIPPLSVILTWPAPNYDDPPTRGNALLVVNIIFLILVLVAVALRFYCRSVGVALRFGWDDAMIAIATALTISMTAVVILADERFGWDRHIYDVPTDRITYTNIVAFVAKLLYTLTATFIRLSLCCFYYRLVKDSGIKWFKWVVHGTAAFSIALCVAFVFLIVFLCTPVEYYWQYPPRVEGHCLPEGKVTLAAGVLNVVADALTTTVPIPLVMRLGLPLKQRIGATVLFCFGFVVVVAGSVRTYYIWKSLVNTWDETWYSYPLWIAAAVEIDLGVICACAPALKSLLHFSRNPFRDPRRSRAYSRSSSHRRNEVACDKLPSTSTSTVPSQLDGQFNRTASLPRSSRSRLHRSSGRWHPQSNEIWAGTAKSQTDISSDGNLGSSYGSDTPVLTIMKRQSVELESLSSAGRAR